MIRHNGYQPSNRVIDSDYAVSQRYDGKHYETCTQCGCSKVKNHSPFCRKHRDLRRRK